MEPPTRGWKSDEDRGPVGAWFVRAIGDRSIEDVAKDMADRGHKHNPDYYRAIMSGSKKPGRALLRALEDYFGSSPDSRSAPQDALITVLERQNALMEAQAAAYYALALSIDNAARGVLERVAGFDEALTQLLELAGNTVPATDGDGAPVAGYVLGALIQPGDWTYDVVDVGGNVLATGTVTAQ